MKTPVKTFVVGYLLSIGLTVGAFAAFWGTSLEESVWTTRRTLDLVTGMVLMTLCGWWLLDRSSPSQLLKTILLIACVAGIGTTFWFEVRFSRLPGQELRHDRMWESLILTLIAAGILIYIGAEKSCHAGPART